MQKRTRSCFSPAKRECGLETEKNKRQDLLSNVPKVLHFTPVCSGGFFVAVLPVRQHKVRDP